MASVSPEFAYFIEHSVNSDRQQNPVYTLINVSRRFSVPDKEAAGCRSAPAPAGVSPS